MGPIKEKPNFSSLVDLKESLQEAESIQFKSKSLVITTKDHVIRKIAKAQLNALVIDLARNNELSPEEKLKLLENTKLRLNKLSQKRNESTSKHIKRDVIGNIDSLIEFVKQKSTIEEELCLETSKVGEWFKEVCSCDIENIGDHCIPKIHAYLLQKVPLSCYLDKEAWYEIVNREFIASFKKLVSLTPWDNCNYFLPQVGDLNLELADPLPMTKFDEELESHLLSEYKSLDNFIASRAFDIIEFYESSENDEQTRLRWTDLWRQPSEILKTIEAIYTNLDIDNLITSLQIQLQECKSLIPEQLRNIEKGFPPLRHEDIVLIYLDASTIKRQFKYLLPIVISLQMKFPKGNLTSLEPSQITLEKKTNLWRRIIDNRITICHSPAQIR